ncbi:xanthine dehydrogenase accessory protein XdhC [Marinobacter lutaoensis]|uniref:Xanthine dehydrogenase accessory protein XdhC n=1 Tax=Marinobacter lutaoensis TaxID=135739 RepID=A0A1V2DU17_9GAMM|nr:xanthine dehydrogenase accessory protein XdhC [Marinobacter lutaoensis]ONF43866.1 xanthine dehydrogenase accessory protein XdhC [Marinobacter lutaoensis]
MDTRMNWYQAVADCEQRGEPYVLVTVLGVTGSVPREPASKMVVTGDHSFDTIGGGHLEYRVCQQARERLARRDYTPELAHFPLGASLGQCCGGRVSVLLEAHPGCQQQLVLFGAGHVAKAVVQILAGLPWRVTWVDSRAAQFPKEAPTNVHPHLTDDPVGDAPDLCDGRHVLILTHNHALDFELCRTLLIRGTCNSIGLIGSGTKARRFRQRLAHRGFDADAIGTIRCPVGLPQVPGKRPMEVAVSICAELLAMTHQVPATPPRRGVAWKDLRQLIEHPSEGDATP